MAPAITVTLSMEKRITSVNVMKNTRTVLCRAGDPVGLADEAQNAFAARRHAVIRSTERQSLLIVIMSIRLAGILLKESHH